jgi:hypothetical protein
MAPTGLETPSWLYGEDGMVENTLVHVCTPVSRFIVDTSILRGEFRLCWSVWVAQTTKAWLEEFTFRFWMEYIEMTSVMSPERVKGVPHDPVSPCLIEATRALSRFEVLDVL